MRRTVLVIALITLIALAALVAFGGAFQLKRTDEPPPVGGSWPVTATLPDPVPDGHGWNLGAQEGRRPELQLYFREAGSGKPVATYTHVTVRDFLTWEILDVKITQSDRLEISPPYGTPVIIEVSSRGWLRSIVGPVFRVPDAWHSIEVILTRVHAVTFTGGGSLAGRRITVLAAGPPEDSHPSVFAASAIMWDGAAEVQLAPGAYWAFVHQNYGSSPIGAHFPDPVEFLDFTVGNDPKRVDLSDLPIERKTQITGRVLEGDGKPAAGAAVHIEALGPCGLSWLEGTTETDAEGNFQAKTVPGALVRVRVDCAAGRAEAVLVENQASQLVQLTLQRWIDSERGRFPPEPVGSVQVLKRGKPVPGATLRPSRYGTFTQADWTEGRVLVLGGVADANGVIDSPGRNADDYLVHVSSPWSADPFELRFRPGSTARAVYELSPPGTGDLRVRLTGEPAELFSHWNLSSTGRTHAFPDVMGVNAENQIEVCGLKPGVYTLRAFDVHGLQHNCEVTIRANEETVVENPFALRRVSGAWPRPGVWTTSSTLKIAQADKDGNRSLFGWSADTTDAPPWRDGFDVAHLPAFAFYLLLYTDGFLTDVALVPSGQADVSNPVWQDVGGPTAPFARLTILIPKEARLHAQLQVAIGCGHIEPIPLSWFHNYDSDARHVSIRLRLGRYRVVVTPYRPESAAPTIRAVDTTIELKADTPTVITLETVDPPPETVFIPSRRVLQPAPAQPLPRPIARLDLPSVARPTMEFHVDVAALPALWHATVDVPDRLAHWNQALGQYMRSRPLELRQRQGRPILCFNGEFQPGEAVTLRVPGFAPVQASWPGGDCVAVSIKR